MWKPGEELVYVGGPCEDVACKCPACLAETLEKNKLYIVKATIEGPCPVCGINPAGVQVFGVNYRKDFAHCRTEFRKPLVVEDEITLKVTENV